jgi:hypothetical protein
MAESFGNAFTIVEVTSDDGSTAQMWLALAKPSQALTLVLAAVPEGWKAEIALTEKQQRLFEEVPPQARRCLQVLPLGTVIIGPALFMI